MRDEHFEWDDEKSKINKAKHGIDFEEARKLWSSGVDEFPSPRGIQNKLYIVALTYRGHRRRLISAREATNDKREKYEAEKKAARKKSAT